MPVVAILFSVLMVVLCILLVRSYRSWKVDRCRETASGTISSVTESTSTSGTTYYFVITYEVNGWNYRFRQRVWKCPGGYHSHVGETVPVHYDPEKPKRAWAETPGRHPYSNV